MKAEEANSDRKAEVHIYVQGTTAAVDEYGEYVDPDDGAICCFVPVEEAAMAKAEGRFWGTTMEINSDVYIDGICRMACRFAGTAVSKQSSRKLCHDNKYLFRTLDGIIESPLVVEQIPSEYQIDENAPVSVGTIEVRVYVLRSFGEKYRRTGPAYYDYVKDGMASTGERRERRVGYKTIQPEFSMMYQRLDDCPLLDDKQTKKYMRTMDANRVEPWATFRFHYRTLDSILQADLPMTCKAGNKKAQSNTLKLERVLLPLVLGAKPAKGGDGEGASTRQSSVAPSVASGPAPSMEPPSSSSKPRSHRRRSSTPSSEMTIDSIEQREPTETYETTTMNQSKITIANKAESLFIPVDGDPEIEEACEMFETSGKEELTVAPRTEPTKSRLDSLVISKLAHKDITAPAAAAEKENDTVVSQSTLATVPTTVTESETDTVVLTKEEETTPVTLSHEPGTVVHGPQDVVQQTSAQSTTVSIQEYTAAASTIKNEPVRPPISSKKTAEPTTVKEVAQKPAVAANPLQISIQKDSPIPVTPEPEPLAPVTPVTPIKRPIDLTCPSTPSTTMVKRPKLTASSPAAIERKNLAEIRRQLAALKTQREETARKRKEAEVKAAPFLQRLAEEREKLEKELADEREAFEREQEGLEGALEVLGEFEVDDIAVEGHEELATMTE